MASSYCFKLSLLLSVSAMAAIAIVAVPKTEAQLLGPIISLLGLLRIDGTLFCTPDGNANGTASPAFPNAAVQLQCQGAVISTSITNESGAFSMMLDPLQVLLSNLLSSCQLTVATPLSTCNAGLPSAGTLVSALRSIGNTIVGLLTVTRIIPTGFRLVIST